MESSPMPSSKPRIGPNDGSIKPPVGPQSMAGHGMHKHYLTADPQMHVLMLSF